MKERYIYFLKMSIRPSPEIIQLVLTHVNQFISFKCLRE